jgi:hypothetical protein
VAYLYRHIRLDKNVPFYVGIGSDSDGYYKRANDKHRRNKKWFNIIAKTEYKVQIMIDDLSLDEAKNKEVEFISLYGRSDKQDGTLCNLTDGGEGTPGRIVSEEWRRNKSIEQKGRKMSEEFKQKRREYMTGRKMPLQAVEKTRQWLIENHPMRGKKMSDQARKNISEGHKGIFSGDKHPNWGKFGSDNHLAKKVMCTETNRVWGSVKDAAKELGIGYSTITNRLNGQKKNNTSLIYLTNE